MLFLAYYPQVAFTHPFSGSSSVTWHLTKYDVTLDVSDTSKLCPKDLRVFFSFYTSTAIEQELILGLLADEIGVSANRISVRNLTYADALTNKKRDSVPVTIAELELEISRPNATQNEPSAPEAVQNLIDSAQNQTRMNEIVNPNQADPTREFISTKTLPTGLETAGQLTTGAPTSTDIPVASSAMLTKQHWSGVMVLIFAVLLYAL